MEPALANECYLRESAQTIELLALGSAGSLFLNQDQHQILCCLSVQKALEKGQEEIGPQKPDSRDLQTLRVEKANTRAVSDLLMNEIDFETSRVFVLGEFSLLLLNMLSSFLAVQQAPWGQRKHQEAPKEKYGHFFLVLFYRVCLFLQIILEQ